MDGSSFRVGDLRENNSADAGAGVGVLGGVLFEGNVAIGVTVRDGVIVGADVAVGVSVDDDVMVFVGVLFASFVGVLIGSRVSVGSNSTVFVGVGVSSVATATTASDVADGRAVPLSS